MTPRHLFCVIAAFLVPASSLAAQSRTLVCVPTLAVFCKNIHVSCAGRTNIPTSRFAVRIQGNAAELVFDDEPKPINASVWREDAIVLEFKDRKDWVRLTPDGRFSHRTFREIGPAMSYGTCSTPKQLN